MVCLIVPKPLPEEGEVVLIKINKVMPFGAYCTLTEYNIDAYLPIAEVAAGWIKNIHEFIKEGQSDVAKVIFVDPEKRAVDISLKKVSTKEKKDKLAEYGLEKRSEQLFRQALKKAGIADDKAVIQKLATAFATYTELINAAYNKDQKIEKLLGSTLASALYEIAEKNIKPKIYEVSYKLELSARNGQANIDTIKHVLGQLEKLGISVIYEGAPHYLLKTKAETYPKAESVIKSGENLLSSHKHQLNYTLTKV